MTTAMIQPLEQLDDKYEVLRKLAEGGMGAIYKVRHRLLDEVRVVKVMRPHAAADPNLRGRFLREAKVAIKVRHSNIAQLFDFLVNEDGTSVIIMEFIDGVTLQDVLRSGERPSLPLAVELGVQSLQALSCLHHAGIIHRDISNDNLMLTRGHDGRPVVKLIDLGIAKDPGGEASATATGTFLGKARYSAPEQFRGGGASSLGPSSDLYSFGVVLYELLTGKLPFAGETFAELVTAHLFDAPAPIEQHDPDGTIPEGLRQVVMHALAKTPDERIASADEFIERLTPFRDPASLDVDELGRLMDLAREVRSPAEKSALVELGRRKLEEGDAGTAVAILREGLAIEPELAGARPVLEAAERHISEEREKGQTAEWAAGLEALLFPEAPDRPTQEFLEALDDVHATLDMRDERVRALTSDFRRLVGQARDETEQTLARRKLEAASRALARLRKAAGNGSDLAELEGELDESGAMLEQRERAGRERLERLMEQETKALPRTGAARGHAAMPEPARDREEEPAREPARGREPDADSRPRPGRKRLMLLSAAAVVVVALGFSGWKIVTGTADDPLDRAIRQVRQLPEDDDSQLTDKLKQIKNLVSRASGEEHAERRQLLEARQTRLIDLIDLQHRLDNLAAHRESVEGGAATSDPAFEARQLWNWLETGIERFLGSYANDPTADRLRRQGREELRRIQQHLQSPELADLLD